MLRPNWLQELSFNLTLPIHLTTDLLTQIHESLATLKGKSHGRRSKYFVTCRIFSTIVSSLADGKPVLLLCASHALENQTKPHNQVIEKVQLWFEVNSECLGLTSSVWTGWCCVHGLGRTPQKSQRRSASLFLSAVPCPRPRTQPILRVKIAGVVSKLKGWRSSFWRMWVFLFCLCFYFLKKLVHRC